MPLIINGSCSEDQWQRTRPCDNVEVSAERPRLYQLDDMTELSTLDASETFGIDIESTVDVQALTPWPANLNLIAIRFLSPTDGRGFSLARQLREAGFPGQVRAVGELIPDQYAQLLACGFDAVEIPSHVSERLPYYLWRRELERFPARYQPALGGSTPIFMRRTQRRSAA